MPRAHSKRNPHRPRLCAVLGHPIRHSASPAMQNAGIRALGLDWDYIKRDVAPENLRESIAAARTGKYIGLNLTVPHKLLAVEMVDALDDSAKCWGAVNTIRFEGRRRRGGWRPLREFADDAPVEIRSKGFNTDADAIATALKRDLNLKLRGAKIVLLGAGGAGQTAALKLASEKVSELFLVNRTSSKAVALARRIRRSFPKIKVAVGYPSGEVDLLLNATSLGLKSEDPLPLEEREFSLRQARTVYDMIYRPAETKLLKAAKAAGCRTANGLGMLLYQGAKALEIWSGKRAPVDVMRAALEKEIYGKI